LEERVELLLERTVPLERVLEELELPEERVELLLLVVAVPLLLLRRLWFWFCGCCTVPLERVLSLEERTVPLERVLVLLPLERVLEELELLPLLLLRLLLLLLVLPLCCWVVLPPLERRVDWARISGAMSMARASIRVAVNVINLLIAQIVLKVNGINNTLGKAS
jgi:hypothetical protein